MWSEVGDDTNQSRVSAEGNLNSLTPSKRGGVSVHRASLHAKLLAKPSCRLIELWPVLVGISLGFHCFAIVLAPGQMEKGPVIQLLDYRPLLWLA
jgi:hypothetical protein